MQRTPSIIYLFMGADGDQSLDAGYLGERLGECYENLGDLHAAKYWYGRAVEESPTSGWPRWKRVKGSTKSASILIWGTEKSSSSSAATRPKLLCQQLRFGFRLSDRSRSFKDDKNVSEPFL